MLSNSWKRIKSLSCRSHCPTCKSTIKPTDFEPGRNNADEEMDPVDRVLENIVGSHGFWQWFILLIGVIGLPTYEMFSVFGLSEQAYRCRMPDPVESILHNLSVNEAMTILWGMNASDRAQYHMDYPTRCYHRLADLVQMTHSNETNWTDWTPDQLFKLAVGQPVPCDNGYVYEPIPNQYPTSVIASFDLTCDRSWLGPLHPTMFMIGMLFGYYLGGWSGDRFGRRPTVLFWFFIFVAAGLLAFFSPNVAFLFLAHLVLGAADSARITVLFVQMFEMTTARWRSVMCSVWTVLQSFGTRAFTSLLAYLLPDWRWLMFAMTAVGSIGVLYICFGPESPRWLVSEGRTDEAVQVLERGYQYNHCCRRSPEGIFTKSDVLALKQMYPMHPVNDEQGNDELSGCGSRLCYVIKSSSIWQMFQSPEHVKRLLLASVIFTCHIYSYYGIMLYGNKIRGVVYVVAVINAASALPGTMMSCILYRVFRWRKRPLLGVFSLAFLSTFTGALCSLTQNHETDLLLIITEGITLTSLEAALDMIYIYIPELFPTMFRSKSLGFCAGCARIGAALCSYTNELDSRLGHGSPMAFYAASILVAILVVLVLPDTSGENLDQCPEQQNEMADF
ncbi:Organic cation transporter protein [Fasciola hepatica]|uniref:Organic cation transporter protein n=1 Tax=Fasciola hepatica TaxID=6192 RepID=A0A2H1BX25_FASHE|nr:Organic cation transporter protein [Fasciola hepatica]